MLVKLILFLLLHRYEKLGNLTPWLDNIPDEWRQSDYHRMDSCTWFHKKVNCTYPEKHFKMLRYYGIYAKHHKQESKLHKCISSEKRRYLCKLYNWQNMILLTFGYDFLKCPKCGKSMFAFEVYYKKTALFEQYQKVMGYGWSHAHNSFSIVK